jgi:hypothetical protein
MAMNTYDYVLFHLYNILSFFKYIKEAAYAASFFCFSKLFNNSCILHVSRFSSHLSFELSIHFQSSVSAEHDNFTQSIICVVLGLISHEADTLLLRELST